MKQRFSSLDIKVIAHELSKSVLSLRVVNIYDLSSRIFLFKFAKPDHKEQLIIDSGFRCHLTSFARATAAAPSAFVTRLRKYLKTRRVTSIAQVGTDRILEIQFSEGLYRLFFEFYAGGNIVLTDNGLKVIAVLRNVSEGAEYEHVSLGSTYNLSERQNYNGIPPVTADRVKEGLQKFIDRQTFGDQTQAKKAKKKQTDNLRKALAGSISEFPPLLLEHALTATGFDASLQPQDVLNDASLVEKVLAALQEADRVVSELMTAEVPKGYILAKQTANITSSTTDGPIVSSEGKTSSNYLYNDFHPFKPKQFEEDSTLTFLEFDGFNRTVDEFFSAVEGQKLESRLQEREEAARKKLENAKQDQANRIGGLQEVQTLNTRKAQAIEANLERVEEATNAINSLIAQGMDWVEIDRLIELEQARHNPVADIIKLPLKLNENTATLLLGEWEVDEEDDEEKEDVTDNEPSDSESEEKPNKKNKKKSAKKQQPGKPVDKRLTVDIDLALSGWSNAREYYDQKKNAAVKEEKTVLAATKALKSAQHKIEADLKKGLKQEKQLLRPVRRQHWFEKFIFFISSDGYLVVGGKDAQQSEIIYKRYLKKGDVYVHADLNGAANVIIKNKLGSDTPIPPSTLSQAGNMSVATSIAWDSKAVMSAWWVNAEQVSKMAHGEYLAAGNFNVTGKKNFLPPAQLLLGFAVLFQVSEESKARHTKHRVPNSEITKTVIEADELAIDPVNDAVETIEDIVEDDEDADEDAASETASEANDEDTESSPHYDNPLQQGAKKNNQTDDEEVDTTNEEADPTEEDVSTKDSESEELQPPHKEGFSSTASAETMTATGEDRSGQPTPQSKKQMPVRGKRGQKKKLASKYADQDEEDRALAMELLGSRVGQEKAAAEAAEKKAREAEEEKQKQRRREQHLKQQQEGKKAEEARLREQEGAGIEDEEEDEATASTLADLDAFVGTPLVGDEILEAIPVCAPWSALGRYKFKAKLQPGSVKKGKAVREILGRWTIAASDKRALDESSQDTEKIWPREAELIKAWKDTEVFGVLPVGKVRVMMGGGAGASKDSSGKGKASGGKRGGRGSKKR